VSRAGWANLVGLGAAIALSLAGGLDRRPRGHSVPLSAAPTVESSRHVRLPSGEEAITDATGHPVPLRPYRRIISTTLPSDRLLADLAEPDRVLAFGTASARQSPSRWRFAGKPSVDGMGPIEAIIALKPDLVLMNSFGFDPRGEQLRAAGIQVFDLGELHGLRTLLPMARIVGDLLGEPDRGAAYADSFRQRFARVAAPLANHPRRRALYLGVIGNSLLGGSVGTSYHDVLVHAGLIDVAEAAGHRDWQQYSAEQVAAMDPELIVTGASFAQAVCAHPGLERVRACREPDHVLALPEGMLADPGPGMLDAAERLFALAYPEFR
jgi:iron complex transport system substrate-binding protein